MYNVRDSDPDDIVGYLQSNTASSTDKVSYREALCSRKYRMTLLILASITVCMNINGMYVIGSYGSVIYEKIYEFDPTYTSVLTQNVIAILDPVSQLFCIPLIPRVGRRTLILFSALTVGLINISIGIFEVTDVNLGAFIMFMAMVCFTSIAQEPVYFLYILETSNNAIYGIVFFLGNGMTILLGAVTPGIVESLGPASIFFILGGLKLAIGVFQYLFLKETFHLTDKEKKSLYLRE